MIHSKETSDHCGKMCKLPYLSENSCDVGLSCNSKSECIKSEKNSCNCTVTFKCKFSGKTPVPEDLGESGKSLKAESGTEEKQSRKISSSFSKMSATRFVSIYWGFVGKSRMQVKTEKLGGTSLGLGS